MTAKQSLQSILAIAKQTAVVNTSTLKSESDPLPQYVSEAELQATKGVVAYATMGVTTGIAGVTYTLQGGPDSGIQLVWNTPSGGATPRWCWAIYPQAAY